jgi:CIC family chloride channel protein
MQDFLGVVFDPDLKDLVVVKELASVNVITTTEEEDLDTCMRKLGYRDFKQLPVVDSATGKKLLGIIFRRDIISAYNRSLVSHSLEQRRNE